MTSTPAPRLTRPAARALAPAHQDRLASGGRVAALVPPAGSRQRLGGRAAGPSWPSIPGACAVWPDSRRVALVSGTNGKTTTTSLLAAALATAGPVVTNLLGANLPPGLAAALAAAPARRRTAVLEVDEAWLGRVVDAGRPEVAVLLNLSRDQLDRNNEVRRLSATWRAVLAGRPDIHVVANADDPLVAVGRGGGRSGHLGRRRPALDGRRRRLSRTVEAGSASASTERPGWACSACGLRRPRARRVDRGPDRRAGRDGVAG